MHQPFIAEFRLATPIIWADDAPMTLDALLAAALYRLTGDVDQAHSEIPLTRSHDLWHGSSLFLIDPVPSGARFIADLSPVRGDFPAYVTAPKRILRTGGRFKPQLDTYPAYDCALAVLFGHGDMAQVRALLQELPGLGKKVAQGHGQIASVHLRPLEVDRSFVLPDGTPARPIPVAMWSQMTGVSPGARDLGATSPPYWKLAGRSVMCEHPIHRALTKAHVEHIEAGVPPSDLPAATLEPVYVDGMRFFYAMAGEHLQNHCGKPGNKKGAGEKCDICGATEELARAGSGYTTLCPVCYSFAGRYQGIRVPGRMGDGWMGVTNMKGTELVTSVEYKPSEIPLSGIPNISVASGKAHLNAFLHKLITQPPEPPFLAFISGNASTKVGRNFRVSWSHERMYLCGSTQKRINATFINEALRSWRESGLPINTLSSACRVYADRKYAHDPFVRTRFETAWEKLSTAHEGLETLVSALPEPGSTDFDYFSRLAQWESSQEEEAV